MAAQGAAAILDAADRRTSLRPALLVGVALIVGGTAWRAAAASRGWLVNSDDVVLSMRALASGLTPHYLFTPWNNHLMPGGMFAYWALTRWMGLAYWPYLVISMAFQTAAAVVFFRLLRHLLGPGWAPLLPLALFQLAPVTLDATSYVSTALMQVPMQLALVWAISAQVSYVETHRRRHLASLAGALVFGLTFFEKSLLIVPLVLLLTVCLYETGGPLASLARALRRHWEAWAVLAGVTISYLSIYLWLSRSGQSIRRPSSAGEILEFLENLVGRTLVPGLVGGPVDWLGSVQGPLVVQPHRWAVVASWLVVVAFVAVTIARRPRAARAWLVAAGYVVLAAAPIAAARLDGTALSHLYGLMPRFACDPLVVVALCAGVAVTGMPGDPPPRRLPRWAASRPATALTWVVALAVVAATVVSGARYVDAWSHNNGRDFLRTAHAEVAAQPADAVFLDRVMPADLIWPWNPLRERLQSTLFATDKGPRPTFVTEGEHVLVLDDAGHVRPAAVSGSTALPGPDGCGWAIAGNTTMTIPLDEPQWAGDWAVRIDYESAFDMTATLRLDGVGRDFPVRQGRHQYFLILHGGGQSVELSLHEPAASLCAHGLEVGNPVAAQ